MELPDAHPARMPFRFQAKWIALFVAFGALFVAIALWVVFGRQRVDDRLIFLDDSALMLGADTLCPFQAHFRDSLPDFPDTTWKGFDINPLRNQVESKRMAGMEGFRLGASPTMPFVTLDVVLHTLRNAGLERINLVDFTRNVEVALPEGELNYEERDPSYGSSEWRVPETKDSFLWILMRSDTLHLFASGMRGVTWRTLPGALETRDSVARRSAQDSLRRWLLETCRGNSPGSILILNASRDPFRKMIELAAFVHEAGGRIPRIAKLTSGYERFLSGFPAASELDEVLRENSIAWSRGRMVAGLGRLQFDKQGIGPLLSSGMDQEVALMPLELDAKVVVPEGNPFLSGASRYSHRDFRIPFQGEKQRLVLREVWLGRRGSGHGSSWWAFYDEGRRTSVWSLDAIRKGSWWSSFSIDRIEPLGPYGFRILLRQEDLSDSVWWMNGYELDFSVSETLITLTTVGDRFSWYMGDEFRTEELSSEGWLLRRVVFPPDSLLRTCGYHALSRESWRSMDWDRALRVSRCITSWREVDTFFRPIHAKSSLEQGLR
ncbi:MAG: hypothetical protein IPK50_01615 [Fibrobacterota bacterium]|nr:hypothetical protein [Fibrobacterota bacterium]QQS05601.1 MAG: hypothetical protein IPK50_01615 [Fibrobacterota bacterium]